MKNSIANPDKNVTKLDLGRKQGDIGAVLGAFGAKTTLYLPNPPQGEFTTDTTTLIANNGNHWRKILTIYAKLAVGSGDFRTYRDNQLLQSRENICFADALLPHDGWHLVAGKQSWQRLGMDLTEFVMLDERYPCYQKDKVLLTPYPDYRQFPNVLVAKLCELMGTV